MKKYVNKVKKWKWSLKNFERLTEGWTTSYLGRGTFGRADLVEGGDRKWVVKYMDHREGFDDEV